MKHLHELGKKIAPLTKEQYEAKHAKALKDAYDYVNAVTCYRKRVILTGKRHVGGYAHDDTIEFSNWDVRTQRLTYSNGLNTNQIPRSVAQESIYTYLMSDYEADVRFF